MIMTILSHLQRLLLCSYALASLLFLCISLFSRNWRNIRDTYVETSNRMLAYAGTLLLIITLIMNATYTFNARIEDLQMGMGSCLRHYAAVNIALAVIPLLYIWRPFRQSVIATAVLSLALAGMLFLECNVTWSLLYFAIAFFAAGQRKLKSTSLSSPHS